MINRNRSAKQKGFSLIEIGFALVIIAGLSIFLIPKGIALLAKSKSEISYQEVIDVALAIKQVRADSAGSGINGGGIASYNALIILGYVPAGVRNTYGHNIVVLATSGIAPVITYTLPSAACTALEARLSLDTTFITSAVCPERVAGENLELVVTLP